MSTNSKTAEDYTGREYVIVREFDAPRELVFKAWTEPAHLAQWWGPKGFSNPVCQWDVRPGGKIFDVMRAPNGADFPMGGEFREITPDRLVLTTGALDEHGKLMFEFLHTITLAESNGKTTLTIKSRVLRTTPEANKYIGGFEAGMTSSLECLAETLGREIPLLVERVYDAPASLVWKALTNVEDIKHWSFPLAEFRAEPGFKFQFSVYGPENITYVHHCRVTEVIPQKKLAYTWRYEGHAGDSLVTIQLFADGNKTRIQLTHSGLETFPKVAAFARGNFAEGWNSIIGSGLKDFVERDSKCQDTPRAL